MKMMSHVVVIYAFDLSNQDFKLMPPIDFGIHHLQLFGSTKYSTTWAPLGWFEGSWKHCFFVNILRAWLWDQKLWERQWDTNAWITSQHFLFSIYLRGSIRVKQERARLTYFQVSWSWTSKIRLMRWNSYSTWALPKIWNQDPWSCYELWFAYKGSRYSNLGPVYITSRWFRKAVENISDSSCIPTFVIWCSAFGRKRIDNQYGISLGLLVPKKLNINLI